MAVDTLVTKRLARFQVESLLSEGSLGPVYLARDLSLDRRISLLVVPRAIAHRPGFRTLFLAAVKAAAPLQHLSIAAIYDIAEHDGEFYLSGEYVAGLSLERYLKRLQSRRQVIALGEALFLIAQAADALAYAHGAGVAHGDIRPERLFVNRLPHPARPGDPPLRIKIAGFGLAAVQQQVASDDSVAGAAPVAFSTGAQEDVQALARIFCQLVTGVPPSATPDRVQGNESRLAPGTIEVPAGSEFQQVVSDIVRRTMATRSEERHQSAEALRDALNEASHSIADHQKRKSAPVAAGVSFTTSISTPAYPAVTLGEGPLLVVTHADEQPRSYRLDRPDFVIGRSDDNDIVLPAGGVSRRHLQLVSEDGRWLVIDLASTNSTLIEGEAIDPLQPRVWLSGETLRAGPYTLRWLPELVELQSDSFEPVRRPEPDAAGASRLEIEPAVVRLQPGEHARFELTIFNHYPVTRQCRVSVEGIPDDWPAVDSGIVALQPNAETKIPLIISPSRSSASTAGRWPFVVRANFENSPTQQLTATAQITLLVFVHYTARLEPSVLRGSRNCRLILRNNGNSATTFNIRDATQENVVGIVAAPEVIRLDPGNDGEADLSVVVRRRPIWGAPRLTRFQVEIHSPGARTSMLTGHFLLKPWIAPGRLIAAAAAALIIAVLALIVFNLTG